MLGINSPQREREREVEKLKKWIGKIERKNICLIHQSDLHLRISVRGNITTKFTLSPLHDPGNDEEESRLILWRGRGGFKISCQGKWEAISGSRHLHHHAREYTRVCVSVRYDHDTNFHLELQMYIHFFGVCQKTANLRILIVCGLVPRGELCWRPDQLPDLQLLILLLLLHLQRDRGRLPAGLRLHGPELWLPGWLP